MMRRPNRRPTRRAALGLILAAAGASAAAAHTPYGQWVVYRQKHLLIGAHRGDARTYDLARAVVAALETELPEARARVARGPRPQRIASLIATDQLMAAVLSGEEAAAMTTAAPPFEAYRPVQIVQLAALGGGYALYASPDLPEDHAWLVADALAHAGLGSLPDPDHLALHPGAASFWSGGPLRG
jgi:hypothetical protein